VSSSTSVLVRQWSTHWDCGHWWCGYWPDPAGQCGCLYWQETKPRSHRCLAMRYDPKPGGIWAWDICGTRQMHPIPGGENMN